MTAFTKSSTTFGPVSFPICLISSSCFSVSFSACSSAALLPEECCRKCQRSAGQWLKPLMWPPVHLPPSQMT